MPSDLFDWAASWRDAGMRIAADAQEANAPGWGDEAYAALISIARNQDTVHIDDILATFTEKPKHPNAWGAVWMRAIKNRIIERSGESRPCTKDSGKHKHQYPVYVSLLRSFDGSAE